MPTFWLLALVGCMPGPNIETVIDELRIVAAVANPPEVRPDEQTTVSVHIADPLLEHPDVLVWAPELGDFWLPELGDDRTARVQLTPAESVEASAAPVPVQLWALACAPGVCDLINRLRAAPPDSALAEEALAELADPAAVVQDLPLEGVSLATKRFFVSTRPESERAMNPVIAPIGTLDSGETDSLELQFDVQSDGPVQLWGYSTVGGFAVPFIDAPPGVASLEFFEADSSGELFVVAVQPDGGSAVWRGQSDGL